MTPPSSPDDRSAEWRLLELAVAAVRSERSFDDVAQVVVDGVCGLTSWPVGHLLLVDPAGRLAPTGTWCVADPERFRVLRQVTRVSSSVATAGAPDDLPEAAGQAGLGRAYDFRVASGDGPVAVLRFYAESAAEEVSAARLAVVEAAVDQLERVVDRARAAAAESARRRALEASSDAYVEVDASGAVVEWNAAAEALFGWSPAEAMGRPVGELLIPLRYRAAHERGLRQLRVGGGEPSPATRELVAMRRSGEEIPVELTLWSTGVGKAGGIAGFVRDLTERRTLEGQLARLALHDRLTGLPNRVLLRDRVEHSLARAAARPSASASVALVIVDLDRFRAVNDSLGHDGGDQVLAIIAERLEEMVGLSDTVARLGGDQYAVLREDVAGPDDVAALAREVLAVVATGVTFQGSEVAVTASVGAALASGDGDGADLLLRDAELALERAKRRGGGSFEVFDEVVRTQASERLALENDLRTAIRHGQLRVVYQPIVVLDTGAIVGFEALVRWQHPERGMVSPADFIPSAEATGLIVPLGRFVLREACAQAAVWERQRASASPLRVSVNVSSLQLAQPGWADDVAQALEESGVAPSQLVLEITESALMEDLDVVVPHLEDLRRLGVRIAIDDFGTGYSSLGYLRRLPVDVLKIDKSFIDGVAEGPHESALARAVIKLASNLGLDAVAEGVSSRRQLAQLRRLRCPYGQGYLFSRPQPADAFSDLLARPSLAADGS
ncbi:MAG: putative bifunctional diguanylate cyclase/phosphodiesterase [Acidimicrobiales bacterium]